jgi:hypothetical protein
MMTPSFIQYGLVLLLIGIGTVRKVVSMADPNDPSRMAHYSADEKQKISIYLKLGLGAAAIGLILLAHGIGLLFL